MTKTAIKALAKRLDRKFRIAVPGAKPSKTGSKSKAAMKDGVISFF